MSLFISVRRNRYGICGLLFLVFACAVIVGAHGASARGENWPGWRGPNGTGVLETGDGSAPPRTWSDKEHLRWRVPLPDRGNSTPIVWNDRVFITQAIESDHRRMLICFDRSNGKMLWESGVVYAHHESTNSQNPYCSASPVTDGTCVVAYFGSAGLYCYDFAGKELWHRDLGKTNSWHGSGASPILYKDLCIVNAGPGTNAALIALDKKTGAEIWKIYPNKGAASGFAAFFGRAVEDDAPPTSRPAGTFDNADMAADLSGAGGMEGSWSTPLIVRVGDHDELIVPLPSHLAGYDPATGKELWTCSGLTGQVFATPTAADGVLLVCCKIMFGGTQAMAIKLGSAGDVTATNLLWKQNLPKVCVGSPVIADSKAYIVTQYGTILCMDMASGKKLAEKRLNGQGSQGGSWSSPVLIGGKIYVPNLSGEVFVIKPSPDLEVLATNSVGEETTCASLAFSQGQVFLRTYKALWCFAQP